MSALSALLGKSSAKSVPVAPAPAASAPAPVASVAAPAPAARTEAPPGAPELLGDLMAEFQANLGKLPQVNPPEAVKTLGGPTTNEVAGNPEPAEVAEIVIPPTSKPAAVLAAEQASKRKNRTAAVVQAELDAALKRIQELEAGLLAGDSVPAGQYEMAIADLEKAHARIGQLETAPTISVRTIEPDDLLESLSRLSSMLPETVTITIAGARK